MKKLILICFLIIFVSSVSALCEEGQIDINNASLSELDDIYGIGPVKAQAIINARPFETIDDLISVSGIGEIVLEKIIEQGLACVNGFEEEDIEKEVIKEVSKETIEEYAEDPVGGLGGQTPLTPEVISLTPKDIKSEEDKKVLDKTDYAKYGFIAFCILIGVLLILKNKRKQKNEIV